MKVESQGEFQATLVRGEPVNHILHFLIAIFTCGLWFIVWLILATTSKPRRETIMIDDYGRLFSQNEGDRSWMDKTPR